MSCWDLDLKDTGLIRDGSDLDCLDASEQSLKEDSDVLKIPPISTCLPSSSSEIFPRTDASSLISNSVNLNRIATVKVPTSDSKVILEKNSEERKNQLRSCMPYDLSVEQIANSEPAGSTECQSQKCVKSMDGAQEPWFTSGWDGRTVSPKDAFLDYDHVYTKLEDEASRRASHSWITNSAITMNHVKNQTIVNLTGNPHRLIDENVLASHSSHSHSKQRLAINTNEPYSCNQSSGKRGLKSTDDFAASQFSLPPQCVPKNAIRWTHYSTTPASPLNHQTQNSSAGKTSAPGNILKTPNSLELDVALKGGMHASGHSSLINLKAGEVPTSSPTKVLIGQPTRVTPNYEEFSASSEEETSTLETEPTASRFEENIQQLMHESSPITHYLALETDSHESPRGCEKFDLSSCVDTSRKEPRRSRTTKYNQLNVVIDDSANSALDWTSRIQVEEVTVKTSPKQEEISSIKSQSPVEKAVFNEIHGGVKGQSIAVASADSLVDLTEDDNLTADDQSSQERESYDISPASSLKRAHTGRQRQTCQKIAKFDLMKEEDCIRKGRRATSKIHYASAPYSRVTRSSIGHSSGKGTGEALLHSPPINTPRRGSRKPSARTAQTGCLTTSRRSQSQTLGNTLDDSPGHTNPTGPIMCGHVDEKTGEKCETMFKRPYDLARHKETIHDSEGPEGDRKPQWKCGQCGGSFSRKDALIRHCRTRNH
ncbi:hypothetical protein PCASD_11611 [Puccinia coronata f. sp. avenae]|uniref:C2H2-type domain-containing protein n=1 Tax=Puccinia coronata f. sp. avenae TaxID=200324 RepID=A0A2N5U8Q1_9BASI|nr:hypothetical protein PCASD_11611 [Puccinia coronata f. sp. avenae]